MTIVDSFKKVSQDAKGHTTVDYTLQSLVVCPKPQPVGWCFGHSKFQNHT